MIISSYPIVNFVKEIYMNLNEKVKQWNMKDFV
jgi:hypothetical protein